jgi:hypothetical protein
MKKFIFILISTLILLLLTTPIWAVDFSLTKRVGVRLGLWSGTGIEKKIIKNGSEISNQKVSSVFEFLILQGMKKGLSLEFSFGVISRGETRTDLPTGEYYWENVNIYPISGSGIYHFFSHKENNIYFPYVKAGVSLVIGTAVIESGLLLPSNPLYFSSGIRTEVTLGFLGGVGIDVKLSRFLVGNFETKYRFAKFGTEIGQNKDYSGIEFGLGVSYIWGIKK